jgi:hypothetical protein
MDGSVTVANVQKRHGGIYRCTATTGKYSLLTYLIGLSINWSEKMLLHFDVQKYLQKFHCHFWAKFDKIVQILKPTRNYFKEGRQGTHM